MRQEQTRKNVFGEERNSQVREEPPGAGWHFFQNVPFLFHCLSLSALTQEVPEKLDLCFNHRGQSKGVDYVCRALGVCIPQPFTTSQGGLN